jgi:tRNA pseudouridine55 synthase
MNGLLLVDKHQGATSHDVVRQVRRLFGIRRVGHAGTLDPLATGLLLVAVGEATRLVEFLMEGDKVYRATLKFGEVTDSQDSEGTVLSRHSVEGLTRAAVERACANLVGSIQQIPPMHSALKRNGVPLYKLARQGVEVEREPRRIQIHELRPGVYEPPLLSLTVRCSKGTYVRTLCHDLGQELGCGAHMTALRRLGSGSFKIEEALTLEAIQQLSPDERCGHLLPLRDALRDYPAMAVQQQAWRRLAHGIPPALSDLAIAPQCEPGAIVLLTAAEQLLAIGRWAPERVHEQRGDFELLKVFPDLLPG